MTISLASSSSPSYNDVITSTFVNSAQAEPLPSYSMSQITTPVSATPLPQRMLENVTVIHIPLPQASTNIPIRTDNERGISCYCPCCETTQKVARVATVVISFIGSITCLLSLVVAAGIAIYNSKNSIDNYQDLINNCFFASSIGAGIYGGAVVLVGILLAGKKLKCGDVIYYSRSNTGMSDATLCSLGLGSPLAAAYLAYRGLVSLGDDD
jgi:hypothetical protein